MVRAWRPRSPTARRARSWVIGALWAATVPCIAAAVERADDASAVRVAVVDMSPADHSITLPEKVGRLEAAAHMDLSFQVSGRVERMVGQGVTVSEGDVIAALDADLEEAELERAELLLREARQDLDRMRGLRASNAASASELDRAEVQVGLRRAERNAARERLERRRLVARFDGVVAEVDVEPGEVTSPGVPIARLLNFDLMRLEVGVPGRQVGRVRQGARAWAQIAALGGRRFEGVVHEVAPSAGNGDTLFEVEIVVPNIEGALRPGMTARAVIEVRTAPAAVVVPIEASVERGGRPVVFFAEDGRARAVSVDGATRHGDRFVLEDQAGPRRLVVRGQHDLEDGLPLVVDNTILADLDPDLDRTTAERSEP